MIGHLGPRVSALLDGQLGPEESERAWRHVETCPGCHDEVRRQGWVKSRLAALDAGAAPGADSVRTALLAAGPPVAVRPSSSPQRGFGTRGFAALGTGAVGALAVGVLAVGVGPAQAPTVDRRPPPATRHLDGVRPPVGPVSTSSRTRPVRAPRPVGERLVP